jgi:pimeloyl-ACP methyl ester carboxylesterase
MNSRKVQRLLIWLCALVLVTVSVWTGVSARGVNRPARQAPSDLYVMFLPGLCAWTNSDPFCHSTVDAAARARSTFRFLITALAGAHVRYTPLFFSYDPNRPAAYTVHDTHQSVARSVDALERALRQVWRRDPAATFDLVGHSLGGVVASSWAVTDGRWYGYHSSQGLLRRVNSIVTYDSPLNGIRSALVGNLVAQVFGGAVWYSLQPDAETIKEIDFFPNQWWRTTGHLHTIANTADRIVPAPDAELGAARIVSDSSCSRDLVVFSTCHGAVLEDTSLNRWIACNWVTTTGQCLPATATPQPTKTPSSTATPVETSTPLPTETPTVVTPAPQGTPA